MIDEMYYQAALEELKSLKKNDDTEEIIFFEKPVSERFKSVFSLKNISKLSEEDFKSFLLFDNNHHWTTFQRQGPRICFDMEKLRHNLAYLLDTNNPIDERVNYIIGNSVNQPGMGKAITTAILLIAYPERYGAWNTISENALIKFNLWPDFERGTNHGEKYKIINEMLVRFALDLDVSLWTLDALWWQFK